MNRRSQWLRFPSVWLVTLGLVEVVLYGIQVGAPLRLAAGDSVGYLSMAASLVDGQGYQAFGGPPGYPIGYPAAVAALEGLGLAMPAALRVLHMAAIGIGCLAWYSLYRHALGIAAEAAALLALLVPASWGFVALTMFALSDVLFFGLVSAALWTFVWLRERPQSAFRWFAALSLTAATLAVRSAGIALLPALAWAGAEGPWKKWILPGMHGKPGRTALAAALFLGILLVVGGFVVHPRYVSQLVAIYETNGLEILRWNLNRKLIGMGEMLVNSPRTKLALLLPPSLAVGVVYAGGVASFAVMATQASAFLRRSSVLTIFAVSYIGMMVVWPSAGVRFLLPVLPLLLAACAMLHGRVLGDRWEERFSRYVLRAWVVAYLSLGMAALGYGIRQGRSGDSAVSRYRAMYEACLAGRGAAMVDAERDHEAYWLLRRYSGCLPVVCPAGFEPTPMPAPDRYRAPPCRPFGPGPGDGREAGPG